MRPSIPRIVFECMDALALLWLGVYWICLVRPADQTWYDLPLGVLCLTMAAWDLVNTVRLLLVRRRGGETP